MKKILIAAVALALVAGGAIALKKSRGTAPEAASTNAFQRFIFLASADKFGPWPRNYPRPSVWAVGR